MLQRRASMSLVAKSIGFGSKGFLDTGSQQARERAPEFRGLKEGGKATGGSYSTVNSAERLSATLSIRRQVTYAVD
jgi:hypothetical protein